MTTYDPRNLALFLACILLGACHDGLLEVSYGDGEPAAFPGATSDADPAVTADGTPIVGGVDPVTGLPAQPDQQEEVPEIPPILHNATVGTRCVGGASARYLVLSDTPSECASDAARIDTAAAAGELVGAVAIPLNEAPGEQEVPVRYCASAGDCRDVVLRLSFDESSGSWTGAPAGVEQTIAFDAAPCAFDDVVAPLPFDEPAAGISIGEVAVYQGVKIPVVEDGAVLAERNAPIIAGRPGVVRVFVEPQADWQERDLLVRLTVGDVVKEEVFRPTMASVETDGDSTVNFALAEGELAADASYAVELLETASCAELPGVVATPRVPATAAEPLQTRTVGTLRVVLVPIRYDADGSGRLPDLSATTVERFRNEAFTHYPVEKVEITVRDAVATGSGLAPNGAGFGEMLNLCLNIRANDNPDDAVYYYCVIQPANSKTAFCGSGCVAGVAPLADATDVGSRAGIGISFGGDGEGVFVHELGHTMGRPHAPCGGANGTDASYPYAGGLIGSWGYDITNGQLFDPGQRADFMGYCDPAWVSDYTYERLYDRLTFVMGVQAFRVQTPPTRWRTAVVESDGTAAWGADVTLSVLPSGIARNAVLRAPDGTTTAAPKVYVTPVADIDAVLLRVEDTGAAGTIEIPGIGAITL